MKDIKEWRQERERLNDLVLSHADTSMKRFFNLDSAVYKDGALPAKTKELLGLVASMVLRCDDCITYHLDTCYREGVTDEELFEAFNVALAAGGSITIPHIRRATERWENIKADNNK